MATQEQIGATYNYLDKVWTVCLGTHADISGAMYDGDFSLSIEAAQRRKHDYILDQCGFDKGMRVLDIGCGWGAFLNTVRERGGRGVGLTLSSAQAEHNQRAGLDVRLHDWKKINPDEPGKFDLIASLGAFEHFCSVEELKDGKQDSIYRAFFDLCYTLLPENGRMFLQTMTWGKKVPDPDSIRADSRPDSDEEILYLCSSFYPGSWLPNGLGHVLETSSHRFDLVAQSNGVADYIETIDQWKRKLNRWHPRNLIAKASVIPHLLRDPAIVARLRASRRSANQECFKRRIMEHYRIVLQKRAANGVAQSDVG